MTNNTITRQEILSVIVTLRELLNSTAVDSTTTEEMRKIAADKLLVYLKML